MRRAEKHVHCFRVKWLLWPPARSPLENTAWQWHFTFQSIFLYSRWLISFVSCSSPVEIWCLNSERAVRGYASKSAHPVFASKSAHSHVIRWLIDWLSTRICLKVCAPRFCFKVCALWKLILSGNKPTKLGQLQPTYGHSNFTAYKTKMKTESKMVSHKKWKRLQATLTQSINQPSNNMGMRRLWDISLYYCSTIFFWFFDVRSVYVTMQYSYDWSVREIFALFGRKLGNKTLWVCGNYQRRVTDIPLTHRTNFVQCTVSSRDVSRFSPAPVKTDHAVRIQSTNQVKINLSSIKQSIKSFTMKVYAWLIDLVHRQKNCSTGMIFGWVQKVTEHRGTIQ